MQTGPSRDQSTSIQVMMDLSVRLTMISEQQNRTGINPPLFVFTDERKTFDSSFDGVRLSGAGGHQHDLFRLEDRADSHRHRAGRDLRHT